MRAKTRIAPRHKSRLSERNDAFTSVGIPSLITVLVVMLLGCFAVLSLITAKNDNALAKKAADAAKSYYAADLEATKKLSKLKALIDSGESPSAHGYEVAMAIDGSELICYNVRIDENNSLYVEINHTGTGLDIAKWQTAASKAIGGE